MLLETTVRNLAALAIHSAAAALAAFIDFTATSAAAVEWIASAAKFRTVVSNNTAHDIVK